LLTATGLVALFSFTSFGVVRMLGGPSLSTIETEIYSRAVLIGDLDGAIVLAILQVIFLVILGMMLQRGASGAPRRTERLELRRKPLASHPMRVIIGGIIAVTTMESSHRGGRRCRAHVVAGDSSAKVSSETHSSYRCARL
jgi:thiamine transport system permease protein